MSTEIMSVSVSLESPPTYVGDDGRILTAAVERQPETEIHLMTEIGEVVCHMRSAELPRFILAALSDEDLSILGRVGCRRNGR